MGVEMALISALIRPLTLKRVNSRKIAETPKTSTTCSNASVKSKSEQSIAGPIFLSAARLHPRIAMVYGLKRRNFGFRGEGIGAGSQIRLFLT
jgi:hypothetical protein